MPIIMTDGKKSIGAYMLPNRKKPALCAKKGVMLEVYGYFRDRESAFDFMEEIADMCHADTTKIKDLTPDDI